MQVKSQDQEIIYTHRAYTGEKSRVVAVVKNPDFPYVIATLDSSNKENVLQCTEKEFKNEFFEYNPWRDVKVDTPILVSFDEGVSFGKRHFAKYEDGKVYAWVDGKTSWSSHGEVTEWKFVKLPDSKE